MSNKQNICIFLPTFYQIFEGRGGPRDILFPGCQGPRYSTTYKYVNCEFNELEYSR